jgi:hypothetical protein
MDAADGSAADERISSGRTSPWRVRASGALAPAPEPSAATSMAHAKAAAASARERLLDGAEIRPHRRQAALVAAAEEEDEH